MTSPIPDQGLWSKLDEAGRMRVAAARSIRSPQLLAQLGSDPEIAVRREVASNPSTPDDILPILAKDPDAEVRSRVAKRLMPPLRYEDRETILKLPVKELGDLVASPHCPTWLLELALRHPSARVRARIAPPFANETLANDPSSLVRAAVATRPQMDPRLKETLARDSAPSVRRAMALNPGTPLHLRSLLLEDSDPGVRGAAARRGWIPWKLHQDPEARVRREVAGNPDAPPEALEILAGDEQVSVRLAVARNPYAPWTSVDRLASDPDSKVSAAAGRAIRSREQRLLTLRGEELWRALVARCGRPVRVMGWPSYGWGRLFTIVTTSDGFGGSSTGLHTSLPSDLHPSPNHLNQRRVFYFHQHIHEIPDWRERVSEAGWDRPGDIPHLM